MGKLELKKDGPARIAVMLGGRPAGSVSAFVIRPANNLVMEPCEEVRVEDRDAGVRVKFRCAEEQVDVCLDMNTNETGLAGKLRASGRGHCMVRLVWTLPGDEDGFAFIPAFMYGDNRGGNSPWSTYPQLAGDGECVKSKPWRAGEWLVRADRSSHGTTSVITGAVAYAMGGRDVCVHEGGAAAEKNGIGISATRPRRLTFSLGFMNEPFVYSSLPGRNYVSRPEGYADLGRGPVEADFFMFCFTHDARHPGTVRHRGGGRHRGGVRHRAAGRLLRAAYEFLHDPVADAGSVADAVPVIAQALVDEAYNPDVVSFETSIYKDTTRIQQESVGNFLTGWCGATNAAYPLLVAGHQLQNEQWLSCARAVLSNIAENAISERSTLFFECYNSTERKWSTHGWWYDGLENPGHSGYVNGHACHYLLLAYQLEKAAGLDRPAWLAAANRVLDHVVDTQTEAGGFGYTYSEDDGTILDSDGFSGCWFTPALASLHAITGDERYLQAAFRAMDFYRTHVEAFNAYGGPHDIHKSPDEEGILAWINAAHILHEQTGDDCFLQDLLAGLDYEFSWKFAYNVVNEVEPLKSLNWCSTGGSVTSVNNSHIHPMGTAVAASILYAVRQTADPYLASRLVDTVRWSLTIYLRDGDHYGWGRRGLINERFCYTDSLLAERFDDGSPAATWFCGHSWASAAVLQGLAGAVLEAEREDPATVLGR